MNEELKKYQDLVSGLMQKLDAERQRASRLEHELSQYRDGKSLADQLAEKDDIINKQKQMIDKLNAQLDWLKRKVWGQSSEKRSSSYDPAQLTFDFGELSVIPEEEEDTGRPMRNSMPIISSARTLLKSADPRIGLPVDPYLKASGASALTSTPKATTGRNGNCFPINSATGRSSSIANLPSMSLSNTFFTRRSARMTLKGQSDVQPPRRPNRQQLCWFNRSGQPDGRQIC